MKLTADQRRTFETLLSSNNSQLDIVSLALKASLDPSRFFAGGDWRGVDFGEHNLAGFDFRGADLRQAKLLRNTGIEDILIDPRTQLSANLRKAIQVHRRGSLPAGFPNQSGDSASAPEAQEQRQEAVLRELQSRVKACREAVTENPESLRELIKFLNQLAEELAKLGKYADAVAITSEAIELSSKRNSFLKWGDLANDWTLTHRNHSRRLAEVGRHDKALRAIETSLETIEHFEKTENSESFNAEAARVRLDLALRRASVNRNRPALFAVKDAVRSYSTLRQEYGDRYLPELVEATTVLSKMLAANDQNSNAVSAALYATKLYREMGSAADWSLISKVITCRYDAATLLLESRQSEAALVVVNESIAILRKNIDESRGAYRIELCRSLVLLGRILARNEDIDGALCATEEALITVKGGEKDSKEGNRTIAATLVDYGKLLAMAGRLAEAVLASEEAIAILYDSKDNIEFRTELHVNLGSNLRRLGRHEEALRAIIRGIELQPEVKPNSSLAKVERYIIARKELALALDALRRFQDAAELIEHIIEFAKLSGKQGYFKSLLSTPNRYLQRYRRRTDKQQAKEHDADSKNKPAR